MSRFAFRPLAFVDAASHEYPAYANFPAYNFDVISAELPCGTSWLASTLLECDFPVWNPWNVDMSLEWKHHGGTAYEYFYPGDPWSRVLPSLISGRHFDFRTDLVPRFSHSTPGHWSISARLVLFVRDPRDALFSAWRRAQKSQIEIPPFIDWVLQIDPTWQVPRCAAYLLHLATWKRYAELHNTPYLVVRFEDVKANARAEFRRLQDFLPGSLDLIASDRIERALERSTFDAVRSVEDQMLANGTFAQRINNAGVPYEYRSHFDASMHEAISGGGAAIYRWLRYDAPVAMKGIATVGPRPDWVDRLSPTRGRLATQALNAAIELYGC